MQSGEPITVQGREYRLGAVLSTGAGSYGQVWAATDPAGREVALKFINVEAMSQADRSLHGHWRAHLEREISFLDALRATRSPHIVTLLAHDRVDGQPVLVLEKLQANLGQWLSQQRREGAPPPDLLRVLDWAEQILDGLDVIHRAGFVYRDLKFSNILVGDGGALLKLADFGSLKREDGDSTRSCIGTPATMAPEQILPVRRSERGCEYAVDFRADYYALGLLLFTLLTERSSTAAQRRLGELLALHGQEGAGQHRDELGGLNDEERELLRRSIEFWTVPVRPEDREHGATLLLTELLDHLLARDPAARPASGAAIRAVLDAVRADQPILAPSAADPLAALPDHPPNRHPRYNRSAARSPWSRRTVGLLGLAGLAGALAWATVIRPALQREPVEPARAVLVGESRPEPTAPMTPSPKSPGPAQPATIAATAPTPTEQASPVEAPPRAEAIVAETAAPSPATAPPAATLEPVAAPSAEPATETAGEIATEAKVATEPGPATAPAATDQAETAPATAIARPTPAATPATAASAGTAPAATPATPDRRTRPTATAPAARSPAPLIAPTATAPRKAIASPGVAARSARIPPTEKPTGEKTVKATPIPARAPEKSVRTPSPAASAPMVAPHRATPIPPQAPAVARPAPKTPASASTPPVVVRQTPAPAKADEPRAAKPVAPASRETAVAKTVPARPQTSGATRPAARSAALPPIELVSNPGAAKAAASPAPQPFELVSRASAPTDASARSRPPIELVSRSSPSPAAASARPAAPSATAVAVAPNRSPAAASPKAPARSTDPITAFQQDAGRAAHGIRREAENIGNWMGRTSASVGTEIQRGLDSANRAVGNWIGTCPQGNGCSQNRPVERRDRWSRSNQGPAP